MASRGASPTTAPRPSSPASGSDLRGALLQLEDLPTGFQIGHTRSYDSVPQAFVCPDLRASLPTPTRREGSVFSDSAAAPVIVEEVVVELDSPKTARRFARALRDAPAVCPASFPAGAGSSAATEVRLEPIAAPSGHEVAASFRATATGPTAGSLDVVLVTDGRYAAVLLDAGPAKLAPGELFVLADRARARLGAAVR